MIVTQSGAQSQCQNQKELGESFCMDLFHSTNSDSKIQAPEEWVT
jgi:sugar diacid utilization regulator